MALLRRMVITLLLIVSGIQAFTMDSLFEPLIKPFNLLPDYHMRFGLSTFALHRNAFFKRQYLAEPHPDLDFCLVSYKRLASVWGVDFQFGLGEVPGNTVFSVLNVAFGINPSFELRLDDLTVTAGIAHRCFHEVDRKDFPIVHYNRLHLGVSSPNARMNTYWADLTADPELSWKERVSWRGEGSYYVKEFFGLSSPEKLNGNNPLVWECAAVCRVALYQRTSWILNLRGESTLGMFDLTCGYRVQSDSRWYWKEGVGVEAFFTRGKRGGCLYIMYHLDDLPAPPDAPDFTLGNSRFSKNGLLQIGVVFLN